jgi:S1-C subfamily serine protease
MAWEWKKFVCRQPSAPIISVTVLSVVFGLAAGAVGTMFFASWFAPEPSYFSSVPRVMSWRQAAVDEQVTAAPSPPAAASRSTAVFYRKKSAGSLPGVPYLPSDALGGGAVLTSDGWLMSHGSVFPSGTAQTQNFVAVVNYRAYDIKTLARDPYSGAVFIKVDASNLPVMDFGDGYGLSPGDPVFAFDARRGPRRLDVIGLDHGAVESESELYAASEEIDLVLRLSASEGVLGGSAVVNGLGQLVAVVSAADAGGLEAIPLDSFVDELDSVLRDQGALRPYLGVTYLDISRLASTTDETEVRGALVAASPDGKSAAVARKGPAEAAGIRAGDIILAVDDEKVTASRSLSDILAGRSPGETVMLTVSRRLPGSTKTGTVTVGATLGQTPSN